MAKPRIAHLAGPNATIQNTPPLVTSNKARARHGLPLLTDDDGAPARFDALEDPAPRRPGDGLCGAVLGAPAGTRRGRALRPARRLYRRGGRIQRAAPEPGRQAGLPDRAQAGGRALPPALHGAPGRRQRLGGRCHPSRSAGRTKPSGLFPGRLAPVRGGRPAGRLDGRPRQHDLVARRRRFPPHRAFRRLHQGAGGG